MSIPLPPFRVGYPLYAGVDMLDVVGSAEVFRSADGIWDGRAVEVLFVGPRCGDPVPTYGGSRLLPDVPFQYCPPLDVLYVPGGSHDGIGAALQDSTLMGFIRQQAETAQIVASVCSGALLLAAAGLLDKQPATTHWAFRSSLELIAGPEVVADYPRAVWSEDRRRITGGGISSTIDESLEILRQIAGDEVAQRVQLAIQYNPKPPFPGGDPASSPPAIVALDAGAEQQIRDYLAPIIQGLGIARPAPPTPTAEAVPLP